MKLKKKSTGEYVKENGTLYTAGINLNCCSNYGKQWRFLRKPNIELCYSPAVPLLDIYQKEMKLAS